MLTRPTRYGVVAAITVAVCVALALIQPVSQDQAYHLFADRRTVFGIGNFADVLSNAAFLLVGGAGLWATHHAYRDEALHSTFTFSGFALFFAFVVGVSVGSAYYHLQPDDGRLLWDRLPISLAFMTLFALIVSDRLTLGADVRGLVLAAFLVTAVLSLVYWRATGDLRIYIGVQFGPIVILPVLCLMFPRNTHIDNQTVWKMFAFYLVSKAAELFDKDIFSLTAGAFGGHAWKHLLAAAAVSMIVWRLRNLTVRQRHEAETGGVRRVSRSEA